jgi:hypothetical protein
MVGEWKEAITMAEERCDCVLSIRGASMCWPCRFRLNDFLEEKRMKEKRMKQFTITYQSQFGRGFKFIKAESRDEAIAKLHTLCPTVQHIYSVRENVPPLATITEQR